MPIRTILPLDEINQLRETIQSKQSISETGKLEYRDRDELFDLVAYLLETAYVSGTHDAAEQINALVGFRLLDDTYDVDRIGEVINLRLRDGKDWRDRMADHLDNGDGIEPIMAMVESECNRDANTGSLDKAWDSGLELTKTWQTMLDNRVRESHDWLEGVTVGIHDKFYTEGDSAYAPGGFEYPENNVNCRCHLVYGMMSEGM